MIPPGRRHSSLELREPASRALVLDALRRTRASLQLSAGEQLITGRVVACLDSEVVVLTLEGAPLAGECWAFCELHGVPFALCGSLAWRSTGAEDSAGVGQTRHAVFSDVRVFSVDRRGGTRVRFARGEASVRLRSGDRHVRAALIDVSPVGLSVEGEPLDALSVGDSVEAEVSFHSPPLQVRLELCRRSSAVIGMTLRLEQRVPLARMYLRQRFSRLHPRAEIPVHQLADLVQRSGYAKLRQADCTYADWQRFSADYSFDYVYRSDDGVLLGHLSGTRVYSRTWLAHQLATVSGHRESGASRAMLYEFMSALPRTMDGEHAYFLAYFNIHSRWHRVFFLEFAQWVDDPTLSVVAEWDCFEQVDSAEERSVCVPAGVCIGPVEEHELGAATEIVRTRMPPLIADAMDVRSESLCCARLNGDSARTRSAIGVRLDGVLVGLALCETGPTNASLFNIMNAAYLFISGSPRDAQLAMFRVVRNFYRERGTQRPLLLTPPGSLESPPPPLHFRERMGVIAHRGAALGQYENYCRFQMGRLFRRNDPPTASRRPHERHTLG